MNYKDITRPDRSEKTFNTLLSFESNIERYMDSIENCKKVLYGHENFIGPRHPNFSYEVFEDLIKQDEEEVKRNKRIIQKILRDNPEVETRYILHKITK